MKTIKNNHRARLGPNDYKRRMRAQRHEDNALSILTLAVIVMIGCLFTSL